MTPEELAAIGARVIRTDLEYGNTLTATERDRRALYRYVIELTDGEVPQWYDWRLEFVETNVKEL